MFQVQTIESYVEQQLSASRFLTWLTGVFAGTALTLAIIAIYGLLAYSVGQRTREIGVRAALGAGRGQLLGLVVGQGVTLAVIGVVAGGDSSLEAERRPRLEDDAPGQRGLGLLAAHPDDLVRRVLEAALVSGARIVCYDDDLCGRDGDAAAGRVR